MAYLARSLVRIVVVVYMKHNKITKHYSNENAYSLMWAGWRERNLHWGWRGYLTSCQKEGDETLPFSPALNWAAGITVVLSISSAQMPEQGKYLPQLPEAKWEGGGFHCLAKS